MELMALCVNITQNSKIAAHFAQNLRLLLRQSLKNRDSLMLKMVSLVYTSMTDCLKQTDEQ